MSQLASKFRIDSDSMSGKDQRVDFQGIVPPRLEDASLRDCLESISVLEVALREQRIKKARR